MASVLISDEEVTKQLNEQKLRNQELREINYKLHSTIEKLTSESIQPNNLRGNMNGDSDQSGAQPIDALKAEILRYKFTMDSLVRFRHFIQYVVLFLEEETRVDGEDSQGCWGAE